MSNDSIFANTADVSRLVQLFQTDGVTPATGLTIADLDLTYCQEGESAVAKVDATVLAGPQFAHADNKMVEVDTVNMPGVYRVDWPDAAFSVDAAASAPKPRQVALTVKGAAIQPKTEVLTLLRDPSRLYAGTVATVISQTEFTLAAKDDLARPPSTVDDLFNGHIVLLEDVSGTSRDASMRIATDYNGSSKALKINRAADFTLAIGDRVSVLTVAGISPETTTQGKAVAGTLSTTQMTTDLTETTDNHTIGRLVLWTSGALRGQASNITDYTGSSKMLTYSAVTEAPAAGDSFVIV